MSQSSSPKCPQCGAPLPPEAPGGLCPRCVMAMNLATQTEFTGDTSPEGEIARGRSHPEPPPSPSEIAPLFPQFEVLECLGRGGMGVVYRARQKSLDRLVAIKILAPEREKAPEFAERFAREAKTLAQLTHPNIVTVHDFGETNGMFYLVMEFVDGVNLRQLLKERKLSPEEALAIVPPVCEALQYAHKQGIVHRDIKPENLLLDKDGRIKIADFGIAKILGRSGAFGPTGVAGASETSPQSIESDAAGGVTQDQVIGTPQYMAPEQTSAPQKVDHRADIYSLGVVLYEMLTGQPPAQQIQPPSKKVQVDVRIDEIVLRALEKEPDRRYQTATQFKTMVETVRSGEGNETHPAEANASGSANPSAATPASRTPRHGGDRARGCFYVAGTAALVGVGLIILFAVGSILLAIFLPAFARGREQALRTAARAAELQARAAAVARGAEVERMNALSETPASSPLDIWHSDTSEGPLTVFVFENRVFLDNAALLERLTGLYRQKPFASVVTRVGPLSWAAKSGEKRIRELSDAMHRSVPAQLLMGEFPSELPLEMDDGVHSVTVPVWSRNQPSLLNLDDGTLNQLQPSLSLDTSNPDVVRKWINAGLDAYVPENTDMLVFPTLPAILTPAPGDWDRAEFSSRSLVQKVIALSLAARSATNSNEHPTTALFPGQQASGWLLTDFGSLLLVKVEKAGNDPVKLKVSWRRARQVPPALKPNALVVVDRMAALRPRSAVVGEQLKQGDLAASLATLRRILPEFEQTASLARGTEFEPDLNRLVTGLQELQKALDSGDETRARSVMQSLEDNLRGTRLTELVENLDSNLAEDLAGPALRVEPGDSSTNERAPAMPPTRARKTFLLAVPLLLIGAVVGLVFVAAAGWWVVAGAKRGVAMERCALLLALAGPIVGVVLVLGLQVFGVQSPLIGYAGFLVCEIPAFCLGLLSRQTGMGKATMVVSTTLTIVSLVFFA